MPTSKENKSYYNSERGNYKYLNNLNNYSYFPYKITFYFLNITC